jgi:hypothetical protein
MGNVQLSASNSNTQWRNIPQKEKHIVQPFASEYLGTIPPEKEMGCPTFLLLYILAQ